MIKAAGLSPVNLGLALAMAVAAVLLNVIPNAISRLRDNKRKETVRMNSDSTKSVVLTASTSVGSALMTNIAATAVVPS